MRDRCPLPYLFPMFVVKPKCLLVKRYEPFSWVHIYLSVPRHVFALLNLYFAHIHHIPYSIDSFYSLLLVPSSSSQKQDKINQKNLAVNKRRKRTGFLDPYLEGDVKAIKHGKLLFYLEVSETPDQDRRFVDRIFISFCNFLSIHCQDEVSRARISGVLCSIEED